MNQPPVFISCVSPEFRQTRSRVATILTRLGYTPVIQEIFGTEAGDLRQVLRDKIDACKGLVQIVGYGYGAEPPTADANFGRVSYTQFEFLYAREKKKKTWLLFAGDASTRDTPLDRLDLPNDPAHPEPAAYQAERRALQLTYRDERQQKTATCSTWSLATPTLSSSSSGSAMNSLSCGGPSRLGKMKVLSRGKRSFVAQAIRRNSPKKRKSAPTP